MLKKSLFLSLLFLMVACSSTPTELPANIDQQQLVDLQQSKSTFLLLDVRSREEYKEGHIPGAINISHKDLPFRLVNIADFKDRNIIVYCRSGRRAQIAIDLLKEKGFSKLTHLEGDMLGWQESNLPVATK